MAEFHQYKTINSKLKKKFFLQKPNLSETSEQFQELSKELKDQRAYSGFCCLAVARCEESLGNQNMQLQALLDSAHHFRDANEKLGALDAYLSAISIADIQFKTGIWMDLAKYYEKMNEKNEAAIIYSHVSKQCRADNTFIESKMFDQALQFHLAQEKNDSPQDNITSFLLKSLLFQSGRYDPDLPIIKSIEQSSTSTDELINLNMLLESLHMYLKVQTKSVPRTIFICLQNELNPFLSSENRLLLSFLLDSILHKA